MDTKGLKIVLGNRNVWTSCLSSVVCAALKNEQLQENGCVLEGKHHLGWLLKK